MAYQYVDAPASVTTILGAIITFAVANAGFSNQGDDSTLKRLSKSGHYYCFEVKRSGAAGIQGRLTGELPTSGTWKTLTNGSKLLGSMFWNISTTSFTGLHLFTQGLSVYAALELVPNVFVHLSFGLIKKFGTYTGGEQITGQCFSSARGNPSYFSVGSEYDGPPENGGNAMRYPGGTAENDYTDYRYVGARHDRDNTAEGRELLWTASSQLGGDAGGPYPMKALHAQGVAAYNLRRPLFPIYAMVRDISVSDNWQVVGELEGCRFLNLSGLTNKTVLEDDWMVFPYTQQTTIASGYFLSNSGDNGIAYKK